MNLKTLLKQVAESRDLTADEAFTAARIIMEGRATGAQIGALLIALRMKGETIDEITGFVRAMREKASPVVCKHVDLVDTCGTGGDSSGTFNVSTVSALVAAGAGCRVAKHGNRSVSSRCGSADLLSGLDVAIDLPPAAMGRCIDQAGMGFLFAPLLHGAMKHAIGPRREVGVRTLFNVLGPLTNPAGAKRQLLGVFSNDLIQPLAYVLRDLGSEHVLVVHGDDGLDEITLTGKTHVSELIRGDVRSYSIEPEDFGLTRVPPGALKGGAVEDNVQIALDILSGQPSPRRDVVLLNAGAVIHVAGQAADLKEGISLAAQSIDSGQAMSALEALKRVSQKEVKSCAF